MQTKKCSKCKEAKAVDEFQKNKSSKDGLRSQCKVCTSERSRKYHEENREAERERNRKYHEENRGAERERKRKYEKENREMTRAMATKSGSFALEEDLVILDETLTIYQKAVKLGRTYSSIKHRSQSLRKKERQNA